MSSSNLPNKLRDIPVFIGNPWVRVIDLLDDVEIVTPVTAEVWFGKVNHPEIVVTPVVVGHTITVTLTPTQIALLPSKTASLNIKFGTQYVLQQKLTPTYEGAIPEDVVEEYDTPGLGIFRVSYFSDETNAKISSDAALLATEERQKAEKSAANAYDYMIAAQNASTGAIDPAGTFNASTGVATQAQSATNPATTFTPTASSTKPKGYFLDINVAGTTSITGSSISVAKGGKMRSNGVGFPWTYIEPADTGYQIASDLNAKFESVNLANPATFISGRLMGSNGLPVTSSVWSTTGSIPVTPGTTIAMNTAENVGFNYGCFFTSGGAAIPAAGWDGPGTKTKTVPATAAFFVGSFHNAYGEVQVEIGSAPTSYVGFNERILNDTKLPASQILPETNFNLVTDDQLESIDSSSVLASKFATKNIANPASFLGRYMQANGTPVTDAAWRQTGSIVVTPGQYLAMNTNADAGWQYGCFATSAFVPMPSYGWNNTNVKNVQVPVGAGIFIGSFPAVNAGSAMLEIVPSISTPPSGYVKYGNLSSDQVSIPAANVAFDKERQTLTSAEKNSLGFVTALSDKMVRYEAQGWIQKINLSPNASRPDMDEIFKIITDPLTDFVPYVENGSIDTGGMGVPQYCPYTENSYLWPENCREDNFWKKWVGFIWKNYYPGQRHARFDTPGFFTVSGSVTTTATNVDDAWGHVWPSPSATIYWDRFYQLITPNTPSDVAATSHAFPANFQKAAMIFSGSHLSGALTMSVSSGNGGMQAWDKATSAWVELNGYVFNTATPDEFKSVAFLNSTQIRKDQPSMILKIRRTPNSSATTTPTITSTMAAGKRIEFWGLYYTSQSNLFIPVNHAKASHTLGALQPFHEFGLNKIEPNVYIMGCPTINEMQQIYNGNTTDLPTVYSARFTNFLTNYIVGLTYIKGIYCRIRGFSRGQGVYGPTNDQSVIYAKTASVNGWTYMNYKNQLVKDLNTFKATRPAGSFAVADHTSAYVELVDRIAEDKGISKRQAHYNDVANTEGECMTADSTHENELGSTAGFRRDASYWIA